MKRNRRGGSSSSSRRSSRGSSRGSSSRGSSSRRSSSRRSFSKNRYPLILPRELQLIAKKNKSELIKYLPTLNQKIQTIIEIEGDMDAREARDFVKNNSWKLSDFFKGSGALLGKTFSEQQMEVLIKLQMTTNRSRVHPLFNKIMDYGPQGR